jgi:tight adherence protein C
MVLFLVVLSFLFVLGLVMSGYYTLTAESPVAERLRTLTAQRAPGARPATASRPRFMVLGRLVAAVGKLGFGGDEQSLSQMLSVAGIRTANATMFFVGVRTILSVGPGILVAVLLISRGDPLLRALLGALFAWAAGHIVCNYFLRRRANTRIRMLTINLPDTLDLMVVSLEAGLGLNATIQRVGEERSAVNDPLGLEFGQVTYELREGRSREDALRSLGDRNGVDDLKSLAGLIIQSDRLGSSMSKTLRAHADVLRTKRRQRAEEEARKLPIKMLFPLAFFILPALFIVAVGPAFLTLAEFFAEMARR